MALTVRVLYDFEAQEGSSELCIRAGETLTLTRQDVGEGWWEGVNSRGQQGLFPESYVEVISPVRSGPPAMAPPPLPSSGGQETSSYTSIQKSTSNGSMQQTNRPLPSTEAEDFDDDWSEDDSNGQPEHGSGAASMSGHSRGGPDAASKGTVRMKNINRFSNFVKSGMEGYILKPVKLGSQPVERHEIILTSEGPQWAPITQTYTCSVDKPKKESKMKGLKSFIAYSLTSTLSGIQVSRRYKHFDWLHERLTEKYILTPIPPLPEKQVSGRYEEDLIEHRKQILQLWVNKLCRHPVLSKSDVWIHFLTCTDEKQWKQGKRKSEKDEYTGGNFFQSIAIPAQPLDTVEVERYVETFSRMTRSLDDSVRGLFDRANDTYKRQIGPYKASFQKMASAFEALGHSFELDQSSHNQSITRAIKQTSTAYRTIGDMHEQQPKKDLEPLLDALFAYKGMLSTVPDIVNVHKSALSKLKENEKLSADGKIPQAEAEGVRQRVDTISYAMLAEINHFSKERVTDFKVTMVEYLRQQVQFYQQIAGQLQGALTEFENV